ncbi:hypothetical protein FDO65_09190 [Nakamurella flava]|uniref:O-antigen ligase family protein n=1 Tax=Nakamurella flava TaxID=2576308 RepID=A0A4U6QNQ2_9ACTN|nr:hypothetical protein [Nakamurella flava]TKV61706.1 hypothetical protein FDO65_09190 [Nakamurella flava]
MQLVAWVAICLAAAVLLRDRLIALIVVCLVLWAAVPGVASVMVTGVARGNPLAFHFATWLILLTFAVQMVHQFHAMIAQLTRHVFVFLGLTVFLVAAFLTSRSGQSGGGLVLFLSQMVGPILLFWMTVVAIAERPERLALIRNWLLAIAAIQSVLAVIEWSLGGVLLYREYYATNYWFDEVNFPRWMGTLDHPLTLSLLICAVLPLLSGVRSVWLQLGLMLVLLAGLLATQSRTGLAVAVLGVVYVLTTSPMKPMTRFLALSVVIGSGAWVASSQLSAGVAQRLTEDGGSAGAREAALTFFYDNLPNFLFTGGGIGSASGVAERGGLTTSLESSFLIYAVDLGALFTLLYFGTQLALVVRSFGPSTCRGLWLAGLLVVIVPQTFNALNSQTFAGVLVWTIVGLCTAMADRRLDATERSVESRSADRLPNSSRARRDETTPSVRFAVDPRP